MDKIKRLILCPLTTSICNLRCQYCYLSQRGNAYQGKQAEFLYSPEYVAKALSKQRLGGTCYFNLCADGETLLTKDIEKYIFALTNEGHYVEIVTNLTITSELNKILDLCNNLLDRITFKCSFHYVQLKKRGLLDVFASNVNKIWGKGGSANIEITPDDELIAYIDEMKEFSIKHFGALPHLTIARDDRRGHDFLTNLPLDEYTSIWSQFDSDFWRFKMNTFNVKRKEYCYSGAWSLIVFLETGIAKQCYYSRFEQNIFKDINKPIKWLSIGKCLDTHCYNSHALLTLGCIPRFTDVKYGNIRDRIRIDGKHWIQEPIRSFLNSKLEESNEELSLRGKLCNFVMLRCYQYSGILIKRSKKLYKKIFGK